MPPKLSRKTKVRARKCIVEEGENVVGLDGAKKARRIYYDEDGKELRSHTAGGFSFNRNKHFSKSEHEKVVAAAQDYCEKNGMTLQDLRNHQVRSVRALLKIATSSGVLSRSPRSIWAHLRAWLKTMQGNWSDGEVSMLKTLLAEKGPQWTEIANRLGRSYFQVKDKWKSMCCLGQRKRGSFGLVENWALRQAVLYLTHCLAPTHNIPWKQVHKWLPHRTVDQCRLTWYLNLLPKLLSYQDKHGYPIPAEVFHRNILRELKKSEANYYDEVNWLDVNPLWDAGRNRNAWKEVRLELPNGRFPFLRDEMPFREQVEWLYDAYEVKQHRKEDKRTLKYALIKYDPEEASLAESAARDAVILGFEDGVVTRRKFADEVGDDDADGVEVPTQEPDIDVPATRRHKRKSHASSHEVFKSHGDAGRKRNADDAEAEHRHKEEGAFIDEDSGPKKSRRSLLDTDGVSIAEKEKKKSQKDPRDFGHAANVKKREPEIVVVEKKRLTKETENSIEKKRSKKDDHDTVELNEGQQRTKTHRSDKKERRLHTAANTDMGTLGMENEHMEEMMATKLSKRASKETENSIDKKRSKKEETENSTDKKRSKKDDQDTVELNEGQQRTKTHRSDKNEKRLHTAANMDMGTLGMENDHMEEMMATKLSKRASKEETENSTEKKRSKKEGTENSTDKKRPKKDDQDTVEPSEGQQRTKTHRSDKKERHLHTAANMDMGTLEMENEHMEEMMATKLSKRASKEATENSTEKKRSKKDDQDTVELNEGQQRTKTHGSDKKERRLHTAANVDMGTLGMENEHMEEMMATKLSKRASKATREHCLHDGFLVGRRG